MKPYLFLLLFLVKTTMTLAWQTATGPDANGIVYVIKGGTGTKAGNSWANAINEVADALKVAKGNPAVKEIWVAAGTYSPLYAANDLNNGPNTTNPRNAFVLVKNVILYGGFSGTETRLGQRSWNNNKSILTGEMQSDNNTGNNTYHVVVSSGDVGSAAIDGFTISDGNPNQDTGSGNMNVNGNLIADRSAGGIYISNSSPLVQNCQVLKNNGYSATGVMNEKGNPVLINTLIAGNSNTRLYSYAFFSASGSPALINVSFVNNSGTGPLYSNEGGKLYNSIIWGNMIYAPDPPDLSKMDVQNCIAQAGAGLAGSLNTDPSFIDPANADYRLKKESPAVDQGSNALYPGLSLASVDLSGNMRVYNYANGGKIDIGAYEYQGSALPVVLDCDAATAQANSANRSCIGCIVTNSGSAVDADISTASTLNMTAAILGANMEQTLIFPAVNEPGDTVTVMMSVPSALLAASTLSAIEIGSANNQTSNGDDIFLSSAKTALKVIANGNSLMVKFVPGQAFDRITIRLNSGIVDGLNSLQIYYATKKVAPPSVQASVIRAFNGEAVTLKATASANTLVQWYTDVEGGSPLTAGPAVGTAVTIPPINASTTYYAQSKRMSNGCVNPVRVPVTIITTSRPGAVITTSSGKNSFTAGDNMVSTPITIDPAIEISNQATSTLSSATVAITGSFSAGHDILVFNNNDMVAFGNISPYYDPSTGILKLTSLNATATVLQWKSALSKVTYTNSAITPDVNDRVISFKVNDGANDSNTATKIITVSATDQTPILTLSGENTIYTSGKAVAVDAGITVSDLDNTTLASASIHITNGFQPEQDVLSLITGGAPIGNIEANYNASKGILTLTSVGASATLAQWQNALSRVNYINSTTDQRTGDRTIVFTVNDGTKSSDAVSKILAQKALLAQTITAGDVSKVYGALDFEPSAMASSTLQVSYTSNDKNIADAYLDPRDSKWKIKIKKAGSVLITVSQSGNGTYSPAPDVTMKLTITPAPLTITALSAMKTYDKVAYQGGNGVTFSSFVAGETQAVLGGILTYTGTAQGALNAGTYTLTPSGLTSSNYSINFVEGVLTISKAELNIIAEAKSKVYGESDPALTYTVSPALSSPDQIIGALGRTPGENVNTYLINQNTLSAGPNYTLNYQNASLTITKALLTVTAENQMMCLGNNLPVFSITYSGFKNGDGESTVASKPVINTLAKRSSPAGNYVLTPTGGTALNYTFIYVNGDLKINSLPIVGITSDKGNNVSKGETLVLTATGGTTYGWTGANIISGRNSAVLTVRPTQNETYTVTATNSSGCSQSQTYSVTIRDDFQAVLANNILSPNGDGVNDVWVVKNIDLYPNNEVKIFDKAGRLIYSKRGYDNTWDGTFNGNALAENTYYYIIDFGTGKLKQKGYITLIRQQ